MKNLKLLVVSIAILFLIAGCGSTSGANKVVTSFFDTYKSGDIKGILQYVDSATSSELTKVVEGFSDTNEDTKTLVDLVTKDLDYKIVETTVKDDTAVVEVVVSNNNLQQFMNDYMSQYFTYVSSQGQQDGKDVVSDEELDAYAHDLLAQKLQEDKKTISISFDIILKNLKDKGWQIEADDNLVNAVTGNYFNFLKELGSATQQATGTASDQSTTDATLPTQNK